MLREYEKTAKLCAAEKVDHTGFLLRLVEMELIDRDQRAAQRRRGGPISLDHFAAHLRWTGS